MLHKLLAAASLLVACAPCAWAEGAFPSPGQLSLIDRTCTQVMGFRRGETYFAACQENLLHAVPAGTQMRQVAIGEAGGMQTGKSFYEVNPGVRWNRERTACAQIGLLPDSTAFHQCAAGLDGAFLPSPN